MRQRSLLALLILFALLLLTGCSGERTFSEEEFIEEINNVGGGLTLGVVVTENPDGVPVRSVSVIPEGGSRALSPEETGSSGTMIALDDVETARAEFARCEGTTILVCYRAANVVLRFEGIDPAQKERLVAAVSALEGG